MNQKPVDELNIINIDDLYDVADAMLEEVRIDLNNVIDRMDKFRQRIAIGSSIFIGKECDGNVSDYFEKTAWILSQLERVQDQVDSVITDIVERMPIKEKYNEAYGQNKIN